MKCTFFYFLFGDAPKKLRTQSKHPRRWQGGSFGSCDRGGSTSYSPQHTICRRPQKTKTEHKQLRLCFIEPALIKEALIKSRLTTWHTSCLQIFRHLARKLLEIRKYSCVAFVQADKKSDGAICAPDLISTSLKSLM